MLRLKHKIILSFIEHIVFQTLTHQIPKVFIPNLIINLKINIITYILFYHFIDYPLNVMHLNTIIFYFKVNLRLIKLF